MYPRRVVDRTGHLMAGVAALFPVALLVWAPAAEAYVGPGVGMGAIALVAGMLGSLVLWFTAILWYPFRRMLHRRREAMKRSADSVGTVQTADAPSAEDSAAS